MAQKLLTIHPDGSNIDLVRRMADDVITAIIGHLSNLNQKRVFVPRDDALKVDPPLSWEETLAYIEDVLEHAMQVGHPRFFGHMDSGPLYVSMLADWVTSALNQNMLSPELSPLATKIENQVIGWLCQRCGYTDGEGTLVSGGTMANFTGLLLALHQTTNGRFRHKGVWALPMQPVIFTSEQAHYSITKVAASAGIGEQSVEKVQTDACFRMDVSELALSIQHAKDTGKLPLMVVATAGTTSTGSVDPVAHIATLCREHGIWLHVDAAHGGGMLFSRATKSVLDGISQADSITIDPHKWLMQPKSMGAILTRHQGLLSSLFQADAPYLQRDSASAMAMATNRGSMTFQGSRRFDALRLWVTRLYLGDNGIAQMIDHNMHQVQIWRALLQEKICFELAHEPDLNLLCFRYRPRLEQLADSELDRVNEEIQQKLMQTGEGFVSITTLNHRKWLRSVFLNPSTTALDMRVMIEEIERWGRQFIG